MMVAIKLFLSEHTLFPLQFVFCGVDLLAELSAFGINREELAKRRKSTEEDAI
jgi:hypothetical protein